MDVPTHDTIGLNIYRELVGRETRSVGTWEKRYGKKALTRKVDPAELVNLSTFDSTMGMPMPLDVQLKMMKEANRQQNQDSHDFEAAAYPFKSSRPVSQASIGVYGENAWHTQPRQETGAPAVIPEPEKMPRFAQRIWSVEHEHYKYESLLPHHVTGRLKALGELNELGQPWTKEELKLMKKIDAGQ